MKWKTTKMAMEWLLGRENTRKIRKIEMMIEKKEIRNQAIRHIIEIDKPMEFFSFSFTLGANTRNEGKKPNRNVKRLCRRQKKGED